MRITTLALSIGFLPFACLTQPTLKSVACDAVATVQMSRDPKFKSGQQLCMGQAISNPSAAVLIKCIHSGSKLWLTKAEDLNRCSVPLSSRSSLRGDDPLFRARGDDKQDKPTLLMPKGNTTKDVQPTLAWKAVPGAERYVVTIWSNQPQSVQTAQTSLTALSGMPLLIAGKTYTIIVKAISSKGLISKSVSTLSILP